MTKLLKPFILLLFIALLPAACSSDDDNNTGVNGKWRYAGQYNNTTNTYLPQTQECNTRTLILKSKGTGLQIIDNCQDEYRESFTWKQINSTDIYSFKRMDFEPENVRLTISPTNDTLRLESAIDNTFTEVYKRQ